MTQQEFTQRTKFEVDYKEFQAINEVYMNSDVDKDVFCKMWVAMNKTRIAKAIEAKKKAEAEAELRYKIGNILNKYYTNEEYGMFAYEVLNKREIKYIEQYGIEMERDNYNMLFNSYTRVPKTLSEICFDIKTKIA